MGFITNLQSAKDKAAERSSGGGDFEDRPKTVWASLPNPGDSAKVIPLQELDEGSPNFNEKLGKGLFVLKHSNPDNWKKSAMCTADEGSCYGCDQGWYQKMELLINVLFDNGKDEPFVAVLAKGTGKNSVGRNIMNIAGDADYDNSISDKTFKYTREGKGTDTTYDFSPLPKPHKVNLEQYADQLFDLTLVPFKVKPEKQEAYYLDGQEPVASKAAAAASTPVSAASVDNDW